MDNWAVVMSEKATHQVGASRVSHYTEFRSRQNESAGRGVRLRFCPGERGRMEQGYECLSGARSTLSDQGGAYLVHLFAKIHHAGHLRGVRCVCMCTFIYTYICTHTNKYIHT